MPRIALSYRRDDSAGIVRLLFERLSQRYGHESVFMDIDAIALGEDFRERIDRALRHTDYLLVVIGPRWLGPVSDGRSRIMESNDPVRMEIELALGLGIPIVPILLDHTKMPSADSLPPALEKLTYLNAAEVTSGRDFDSQLERIIGFLERAGEEPRPAPEDTRAKARHNLPRFLTDVIGREQEVAEVSAMLRDARLVTIVGSGGIGKTRLAVEVATGALDTFDDGVWFVDLSALADPLLVPPVIAEIFDIPDEGGGVASFLDRVAVALKAKSLLILLDNCEHVLAAASDVATTLLRVCPGVRVLTTSREPLGVIGESSYRMPSLRVPPSGERMTAERVMEYAAASLFITRARAAQHNFSVDDENAPIIADIVRRLDGIALAIELAAPRVKVLNVQQLDQRLNDRFKLLTGGRTAHSRQQTLRAMIGWSYDLLNAAEQRLLRQCAIFRGGWTLEAAEAVCVGEQFADWDVLDLLASLVDKSLVVVEAEGEEQRYVLLESTREFVLEKLVETDAGADVATRHCAYFAQVAQRSNDLFWKSNFELWLSQTRRELENHRAAIDWGLSDEGDAVTALIIVGSLQRLWGRMARREGLSLLARAEAALPADVSLDIQILVATAQATLQAGAAKALPAATRAVELLRGGSDEYARAQALFNLGNHEAFAGRVAEALPIFDDALVAARAARVPRLEAMLLARSASWEGSSSDPVRARERFDEALALVRGCNDRIREMNVLIDLAEYLSAVDDVVGALASMREAEVVIRERGVESVLGLVLANVTAYLLTLGQLDDAWIAGRESIEITLRVSNPYDLAASFGHLAQLAAEVGDSDRAVRLLGWVDAAYRKLGNAREYTEMRAYNRTLELVRASLPADRIASLLAEGETMDEAAAVADVWKIPRPASSRLTEMR